MERGEEKKEYQTLTTEELRSFKGLESLTDEEAEQAILAIEKLTILIFKQCKRQKQNDHETKKRKVKRGKET